MQQSVALIIAAFNAERTITNAVTSALRQPEAREVIVVDDGSSDATFDVARDVDDGTGRLNVLRLPENGGPSVARNLALEHITAPLVGVLDADDMLLPGRLGRMLEQAGPGTPPALLADDLLIAHPGEDPATARPFGAVAAGEERSLDLAAFVRANTPGAVQARRELGFLKPLIRRDLLERYSLRYDPAVRLGEDFLLYAALLARGGRMRLIPPCGYVAFVSPGSLSHRHSAEDLRRLTLGTDNLLALTDLPQAARPSLQAYRRHTHHKHLHRAVLDAKRQRNWRGAFRHLLSSPAATRYIALQICRDKWSSR